MICCVHKNAKVAPFAFSIFGHAFSVIEIRVRLSTWFGNTPLTLYLMTKDDSSK